MLRAVVLAIAIAVAACGGGAGDAQGGADVYQAACATCHGKTGKPEAANVARLGVRDLSSPEFRARVTPQLVEAQVRAGSKNRIMPSFQDALREDQIHAVAAYVASSAFAH